jgi:hypothetical protein
LDRGKNNSRKRREKGKGERTERREERGERREERERREREREYTWTITVSMPRVLSCLKYAGN